MKASQGTIYKRITRSKTSNDGGETSLPIPVDLIFDIFSRLPAKSIARCRCVSKPWDSILGRPDFTELFLTKSSARPLLLVSILKDNELFLYSAPQVHNPNESLSVVVADYHTRFSIGTGGYPTEMYGAVHGLVFFNSQLQIVNEKKETVPVVYNPSTGQSLHLPILKTARTVVASFFAYDRISKKYKVLSFTWPNYGSINSVSQQVLTLGATKMSYRMVECSPHFSLDAGICINGVLYYIAKLAKPGYTIACFDVRSEKCRFLEHDEGMILRRCSTLVNYKGKLGVLLTNGNVLPNMTCFELWVLVDSEKYEWSKHVYALPDSWKDIVGNARFDFAGMTCNNEVVWSQLYLLNRFYVLYYNLEKKTIKRVEIQGMDAIKPVQVHISLNHVEDVKLMQVF